MRRLDRAELERLRALCETAERRAADPIGCVPTDADLQTTELAAFLSAGLAFGNVTAIAGSVRRVLANLDRPDQLETVGHRWVRGPDIRALVDRIRALQAHHGSLGAAFAAGYQPGDMRASLSAFAERMRLGMPPTRGSRFLVVSPDSGSACKRMNLFLRWMCRAEHPDLGLWPAVRPADLVIPLDVHVIRFGRRFGLTQRRSTDWKMAAEITAGLRRFSPDDPLRYDFAICHYGMIEGW